MEQPTSPTQPQEGGDTEQSPSVPISPNIPAEFKDFSNQETLRATNHARKKFTRSAAELTELFEPPPPAKAARTAPGEGSTFPRGSPTLPIPPLGTSQKLPPLPTEAPPLPTEAPPMRYRRDSIESQDNHRRMPSTIRFNNNAPPTHERQVSWGLDFEHVKQPSFQDEQITNNLMDQFRRRRGGSGRISLEDLQNTRPMENEAQAYLIKALETRDFQSERKLSETGAVFSNVPREDLDALQLDTDGSLMTNSEPSNRDLLQQQRQQQSQRQDNSTGEASALLRPSPPPRRAQRPRGHRRNETVGDKLESLAAAMDVVHTQHLDLLQDDLSDDALPAPLLNKADAVVGSTTSADALHQNANLLFTRHRTTTEDRVDEEMGEALLMPANSEDSSLSTTGSRRWHQLRTKEEIGVKEDKISEVSGEDDREAQTSADDGSPPHDSAKKASESNNNETEKKPTSFHVRTSKNKFVTEMEEFFAPRRKSINHFLRIVVFFVVLPCMGVSALLFYFAGNPPTGTIDLEASSINGSLINTKGQPVDPQTASASWWLLFGVRQVLTFVLAKGVELFFIDFLSVRSRFSVKVVGPWVTLYILQTKGWPFLFFFWSILNFALLSGTRPFFHHWAYWQDYVGWLNEENPSGHIVDSIWHHRLVAIALSVSCIVSAKRFWLGLYLGRQTFVQYSHKLEAVMNQILLVSEVSTLGRAFERQAKHSEGQGMRSTITAASFGLNKEKFQGLFSTMSDTDSTAGFGTQSEAGGEAPKRVIDPEDRHQLTGSLSSAQKARISQLLGQWEEPTIVQGGDSTQASVTELLQFRRALEYLHTSYPFSGSFGLADRRESTIESAQAVYDRLLLRSPDPQTLHFDVLALVGVRKGGILDQEKLKAMIKLFRPDRDGALDCIDFVKAVDGVYRELRLLRASVANSSKIDRAFESIFNVIFYAILGCIILSQIGYDPLALFLSISGVVLGFAFMIGSASSKYFEGLLFILVRRPFQIGDGISLSDVNDHTLDAGSDFWIVEDVDLFTTKVIYFKSSERATLNNGSLANSRVINATLSKQAKLAVFLKFPVSVSYEKLQIFEQAVEQFFKNRPREWAAFLMFVLVKLEADLGYVQYAIIGRHRMAWVNFADILQSKADLMHFAMELSKKLDIWYRNPPLPVDLSLMGGAGGDVIAESMMARSMEAHQRDEPLSPNSEKTLGLKDLQTRFRPDN